MKASIILDVRRNADAMRYRQDYCVDNGENIFGSVTFSVESDRADQLGW